METFGDQVLAFYRGLKITEKLPKGIEVMNPYQDRIAFEICKAFYGKYYHDNLRRFLILGINPGRYGAGITGVPFTDPIKLESVIGIKNPLPKKPELSADFIHSTIAEFGGYEEFFSRFFINSVSPLGFVRGGKNLNYYDDARLQNAAGPFIRRSIESLLRLNIDRNVVFCLGEGQNARYLRTINDQYHFFDRVIALAHPRFIMQYKRKQLAQYRREYVEKLRSVL
ncbi:MAG TPA: uracil-DNA glycosylase family protein [Chryseosolibacter sp.]